MKRKCGGVPMAKRRFHPAFPLDLRAAIQYFDAISPALGQKFRDAVKAKLATIGDYPDIYAQLLGEIRAARLDRFPYLILYSHDTESVLFLALVLGSSDRKKWLDRLK